MIARRVIYTATALSDLDNIYLWIAAEGPAAALNYVEHLQRRIGGLELASLRGQQRDDLAEGLRILPLGKRAVAAFAVDEDTVTILRVFSNGQDWEGALCGDENREAED